MKNENVSEFLVVDLETHVPYVSTLFYVGDIDNFTIGMVHLLGR
jgi:hypothetical protein